MSELDRIPDWMTPDTIPGQQLDLKTWAQDFRDVYQVAEALCRTPFVPREMLGKQADVAATIMKGRELGLDPFDALGSIYIVHGRVGYYADFMRRRIIQAGHTLRILENTDSRAVIEGTRKEGGDPQRASFTAEQARKAGIDLGKYPSDKLIARATSRLCRQVFPDVLSGSLIAEDLIDGVIPADPATDSIPEPSAVATKPGPLARRRASKPVKAAATQPNPAPAPKPDEEDDIAELLGDTDVGGDPAAAKAGTPSRSAVPAAPPTPDDERPTDPADPDTWPPPPWPTPPEVLIPDEDNDVRMISAPQLTKLSILLKEAGFTDRDSEHDFTTNAIGRAIGSAKELTMDEAGRVIDILENDRGADT